MHKTDLIKEISKKTGASIKDSAAFLQAFIGVVSKTLKKGDFVTMIGFGTFKVSKTASRMGRNPQTGAPIKIAASKKPKFIPGKALKDAVK